MNRLSFALFGVVCAVLPAMAECTVSSVSVSQEWPWSPKVQIAVVLSGEGKTDIALSATWSGRSEPLELYGMNGLEGDTFQLSAGTSYLAWDPRAAGVTEGRADVAKPRCFWYAPCCRDAMGRPVAPPFRRKRTPREGNSAMTVEESSAP